MRGGGGVQGMPYVLNLLYFEGCVTMVQPLHPCPLNMHKSGFLHGPTAQSARECQPRTHAGPVLAFVTPPPPLC